MSTRRAVAKYAAAGAVTALYMVGAARVMQPTTPTPQGLTAARRSRTQGDKLPVTKRQVGIVASGMLALTWTATLL